MKLCRAAAHRSFSLFSFQKIILMDYAKKNGYLHPKYFMDDGISGTTFDRPGFREMETLIEAGKVSAVIKEQEEKISPYPLSVFRPMIYERFFTDLSFF